MRLCLVAWLHGGDESVDAQALNVRLCLLLGACHHHRNAGLMGFLLTGNSRGAMLKKDIQRNRPTQLRRANLPNSRCEVLTAPQKTACRRCCRFVLRSLLLLLLLPSSASVPASR